MRRALFAIILVAVVALLLVLTRFIYYPGKYQPPAPERPRFDDITVPAPLLTPFTDQYERQAGTLVIDLDHDNYFTPWELNVLLSRIVSRGFAFEYLTEPATSNREPTPEAKEEKKEETSEKRLARMEEKLRYADALSIILPQEAFPPEEVKLVGEFVRKGGKLLLIGDPTRPSEINSISAEFGLIFETDYLYNLSEYDGNYRNIFITEFAPANVITKNLSKITLYSASSISSPARGIVFTDENTFSSVIETKGKLSPLALTDEFRVLAISDLTFMREPLNAVWDNNQLVSNIADWLTKSERVFVLSDLPHFLEDKAYIACAAPSLIESGIELKNFLAETGKSPELGKYEDAPVTARDMVFIGFFQDANKIQNYLKRGDISVTAKTEAEKEAEPAQGEAATTKVEIGNLGQVYQEEGTSILYLDQGDNRYALIILSDTEEMMKDTIQTLRNGKFRHWLISDRLGIHYGAKAEAPATEENTEH